MPKASINFKPVKGNSKVHNERLSELDYVYSDLSAQNEQWKSDEIDTRLKSIASLCKKLSGRKLQKNAIPVREAVVNLNSSHGLSDLKALAAALEEKKGIRCFQIFIHRDEGKSRDDLNYHAHMLFDWQDKKSGKMLRLNKLDMSQIQDIVSASLGLERGERKENSNRERLEAVEFKRVQEEKKLKELQAQVALEQKKNSAALGAYQAARIENRSARAEHKSHKERFKRLFKLLWTQGIPEDKKLLKIDEKDLIRAIEGFEKGILEGGARIAAYQNAIRKLETKRSALQQSPQYLKYTKLIDQIREIEDRITVTRRNLQS